MRQGKNQAQAQASISADRRRRAIEAMANGRQVTTEQLAAELKLTYIAAYNALAHLRQKGIVRAKALPPTATGNAGFLWELDPGWAPGAGAWRSAQQSAPGAGASPESSGS